MAGVERRRAVITGIVTAVCAGVLCLLLVLPAILLSGGPTAAQEPGGKPPGAPAGPPAAAPGMGPGAGPGPGGPAAGAPGAGGPATGGPTAMAGSAPAVRKVVPLDMTTQPIYPGRPNPFMRPIIEVGGKHRNLDKLTTYGPGFSALPLTERLPFPSDDLIKVRPAPTAPKGLERAIAEIERFPPVRFSSVLQTQDGSFSAVLEVTEDDTKATKIVKPGDVFGPWMVTEIWNDHIMLQHRDTGITNRVDLQSEKEAPRPRRRTMTTQPGMGGPGGMPMAPGGPGMGPGSMGPGPAGPGPAAPGGGGRRRGQRRQQ